MSVRIVVLIVSFICLANASSAAANGYSSFVECIQQQMTKQGIFTGKIDGNLTPETMAAYSAMVSDHPQKNKLPKVITTRSSGVACRQLGTTDFRLKAYWPSIRRPVDFDFSDSIAGSEIDQIRDAAKQAHKAMNIPLAGKIQLILADTPDSLLSLREKYKPKTISKRLFKEIYRGTCVDENGSYGGFAYENLIHICDIDITRSLSASDRRFDLVTTIAHEMVHAAQFELGGFPDYTKITIEDAIGPLWLYEGTAQLLTVSMFFPVDQLAEYYRDLEDHIGASWPRAKNYETFSDAESELFLAYGTGHLAAYELSKRVGTDAFVKYYEDIGLGLSWQQSFEANFGTSYEDFFMVE